MNKIKNNKYILIILFIFCFNLYLYSFYNLNLFFNLYSFDNLNIVRRIIRNIFSSDIPSNILPYYENCSHKLLTEKVTLLITVKDTCSQGVSLLSYLASMLPRNISIIYVYPDFIGCNLIDVNLELFSNLIVKKISSSSSPIEGFLKAQLLINTPYTLLMHNDAYPMDYMSICELFRALENHEDAAFSVPQLYERSENGIIVPHGHHKNLHLRKVLLNNSKLNLSINYDIDFELLTRRYSEDFNPIGYAQIDFMEDHAYMSRTNIYHLYLDKEASYTLEYIDNILSMRLNNTYPWYVPTSRFIFDVDINKISWRDIPYFVNKRSEEIGLKVCNYLTNKWNVIFPNTGIWNYVRYSFLYDIILDDNNIPNERYNQLALYYSWFHSIGLNRYNNYTLDEILNYIELPINDNISISRDTYFSNNNNDNNDNNNNNDVKNNIANFLPINNNKKMINIILNDNFMAFGYSMTLNCAPVSCGMLVIDKNICYCFTYISPYNINVDYGLTKFLDYIKFPSRIMKFVQMKYTKKEFDTKKKDTYYCNANEENCEFVIPAFSKSARLIQWSWFSKNL
jgi:hypothetical protein